MSAVVGTAPVDCCRRSFRVSIYSMISTVSWAPGKRTIQGIPSSLWRAVVMGFLILMVVPGQDIRGDDAREPARPPRNWGVAPIPVLGFAPDFDWIIGLAAIGFYGPDVGVPEDQRTGALNNTVALNSIVTTNGSVILALKTLNYFSRELIRTESQLAFSRIPRLFHGVGPGSPASGMEPESYVATNFRVGAAVSGRVYPGLYVGPTVEYQEFTFVERDDSGVLVTGDLPGTGEVNRSVLTGVQLVYDTTGGGFFPERGVFAEATTVFAPAALGDTDSHTRLQMDVRGYRRIFASRGRQDVVALQGLYQQAWGDTPVFLLPSLGGDNIFRGHLEDRFRDATALSAQVEYRVPLPRRFGVVGFASVGQVAPSPAELNFLDPVVAGGVGFRFALNREQRLNLRVDIAVSSDRVGAFYINAREAF